jgi:predicted negative regulator of RcsB-dependent stress response
MSTYRTEEEQVEAIKKWWKENGRSVVGGIVLGFAIIGGWQGWQGYQRDQGESASMLFDAMRQASRAGVQDQAIENGKRMIGEYGSTAYASFAGLELARLAYERGEKAAARQHLEWVVGNAPDAAIAETARLRLGHVLLDMQDFAALDGVLAQAPLAAFAGEFAALRGDAAVARGDREAAREAYRQALVLGVEDETLLRMKLVDAGGQASAG